MLHEPRAVRPSRRTASSLVGALLTCLAASATAAVAAQSAASAFAVASIKPTAAADDAPVLIEFRPGGVFRASGVTLERLIRNAYRRSPTSDLRADLIVGGPAWVRRDRYDIEARTGASTLPGDTTRMLRTLLEERFQLATRTEMRDRQVYLLKRRSSGGLGPGLRQRSEADCEKFRAGDGGRLASILPPRSSDELSWYGRPCASIADLTSELEQRLSTDVIDETALTGRFDYRIAYPIDLSAAADNPLQAYDNALLPAAVDRSLGLTLTTGRRPVSVLVIVSVSRPTPN